MMEDYTLLAKSHQIICYNEQNLHRLDTGLMDLAQQEEQISGMELMGLLWEPLPIEERVNDWGAPFTARMYEACLKRVPVFCDAERLDIKRGVAVKNTAVRCLPTMQGNYRQGQQGELDRFAKGLLKLGEGVLIYCRDLSDTWYFIRSRQFYGWVLQTHIALDDALHWQQYITEREFVQLLDSRQMLTFIQYNGIQAQEEILMGTRFVLHDAGREYFLVSLPQRNSEGKLVMLQTMIPRNGLYYPGELPLTIQNLRGQSSSMLGEPYDWGGKHGYRDCTGLVSDLYLVFGVYFAGNSTMQMAQAGVKYLPEYCTLNDKKSLLCRLTPGTILYMPGHAMIYLGYLQGKYQILHSVYQIGLSTEEGVVPYKIKRVVTGHLEQLRTDGKSFLHHWYAYWDPQIIGCN